jgi:hypothetical protein
MLFFIPFSLPRCGLNAIVYLEPGSLRRRGLFVGTSRWEQVMPLQIVLSRSPIPFCFRTNSITPF